jgi:hypothetical protein
MPSSRAQRQFCITYFFYGYRKFIYLTTGVTLDDHFSRRQVALLHLLFQASVRLRPNNFFRALKLIFGSYSSYLTNVLEIVYVGLQTRVTHHDHVVARPNSAGEIEKNIQCSLDILSTGFWSFSFVRLDESRSFLYWEQISAEMHISLCTLFFSPCYTFF